MFAVSNFSLSSPPINHKSEEPSHQAVCFSLSSSTSPFFSISYFLHCLCIVSCVQLENLDGDSEALTFSSDSDTDADDWVDAINRLLMQNHSHGRWSAPTQMPAPQQPMMPRSVNGQVTNFGGERNSQYDVLGICVLYFHGNIVT